MEPVVKNSKFPPHLPVQQVFNAKQTVFTPFDFNAFSLATS